MLMILLSILTCVAGAVALRKAHFQGDNSGGYSVGGYIAFILSFSFLDIGLSILGTALTFGLWAVGTLVITNLVGHFFYEERLYVKKVVWLVVTLIGLLGFSFSV